METISLNVTATLVAAVQDAYVLEALDILVAVSVCVLVVAVFVVEVPVTVMGV